MTTDQLLALSDEALKQHLLTHWQVASFNDIIVSGQLKMHPDGKFGWFERLRGIQPDRLAFPFKQESPRSIFIPTSKDSQGNPLESGRRYQFQVQLSRREKRKAPFDLVARNPQLQEEQVSQATPSRPAEKILTEADRRRQVDSIFRRFSAGNADTHRITASLINKINGSMYLAVDRFVFELLQNADDLPNPRLGQVNIQLNLLPEHILFQHNGLPFAYEHVESLSDVANSTKRRNLNTTGYKGIGFKSVYSESKCVYIRSGGYNFHFAEQGQPEVPWQTWPRWTEDSAYPAALRTHPDFLNARRFPVSFALQVSPRRVSGYAVILRKLLREPRFALFMRHLSQLTLLGEGLDSVKLTRTVEATTGVTRFECAGESSRYLVQRFTVFIPEKFKKLRKDETDKDRLIEPDHFEELEENRFEEDQLSDIPPKLLESDAITIAFAAQLDEEGLLVSLEPDEAVLFAYLPTEDNSYGLPLLVNADFILTPNRENVTLKSEWNTFLFKQIGLKLVEWVAGRLRQFPEQAATLYQFIPEALDRNSNQEALAEGIADGIATVPLLPGADSGELVLASEAVLDQAGLYHILPELYHGLLNDGLTVIGSEAAAGISEDLATRLDLRYIDLEELRQSFEHSDIREYYSPADAVKLLKHLAAEEDTVASDWQSIPWLFNQDEELIAPDGDHTYGILSEKWDPHFPMADQIAYLHLTLQALLRQDAAIASWVADELEIPAYTRQQVVQDMLIPAVAAPATSEELSDLGIHYLYHLYRRKELEKWVTDADRKKLLKAFVRCADGAYNSINTCYLSREYHPVFALEDLVEELGESSFPLISDAYLTEYNEPEGWREFWQWCGIQAPDAIALLRDKLLPQLAKAAQWTDGKHEAVLRLALDAYCSAPAGALGFQLSALSPLRAETESGDSVKITACHLPVEYNASLELLTDLPLDLAPEQILTADYFSQHPSESVVRFFKETGCQNWSPSDTITHVINASLKEADELYFSDSAAFVNRFHAWYTYKTLTAAHLALLQQWPLFLKTGDKQPAGACYFSTEYQPKVDIEALSEGEEQRVLDSDYLPASLSEAELATWIDFFAKLGVKDQFTVTYQSKLNRTDAGPLWQSYFDWVDENQVYGSIYKPYRYQAGQHGVENFLFINHVELVTHEAVAEALAEAIKKQDKQLSAIERGQYWTYRGAKKVVAPSLFSIYPAILCTDGELRVADEVFSNSLEVIPDGVPVAAFSYGTRKLEKALGLRTQMSPEDALLLLEQSLPGTAGAGDPFSPAELRGYVSRLVPLLPLFNSVPDVEAEWAGKILLPAANDTWVLAEDAFLVTRAQYIVASSGSVLKNLSGIDREQYQKFCETLGIPVVLSDDFHPIENAEDGVDFSAAVCQRMEEYRVLELIAAYRRESSQQVASWQHKLASLQFLQVPSLRLESATIPDYTVPTDDPNRTADDAFIFVGSLWRARHWQGLGSFLRRSLKLYVPAHVVTAFLESKSAEDRISIFEEADLPVPQWLQTKAAVVMETAATEGSAATKSGGPQAAIENGTALTKSTGPDPAHDSEEQFAESGSMSEEDRKISHEQACKAALEWLRANGYTLPSGIEERFSVIGPVLTPELHTIQVIVRSALGGRLFFSQYEWASICEPNTLLLLYCRHTGGEPSILPVTEAAEQLVESNPNTYVRIPNQSASAQLLNDLADSLVESSPGFRFIFLRLPGNGAVSINLMNRKTESILCPEQDFAI